MYICIILFEYLRLPEDHSVKLLLACYKGMKNIRTAQKNLNWKR